MKRICRSARGAGRRSGPFALGRGRRARRSTIPVDERQRARHAPLPSGDGLEGALHHQRHRHPRRQGRSQLRPRHRLRRTLLLRRPAGQQSRGSSSTTRSRGRSSSTTASLNRFVVGLDLPVNLMTGSPVDVADADARRGQWAPDEAQLRRTSASSALTPSGASRGSSTASGSRSACRSASGLGERAAERRAPTRASGTGRRRSSRSASARPGSFSIALNGGFRGHIRERHDARALKDGTYVDGNLFTYGGGVACRVLEPLDLVAETYGTYLISERRRATASRRRTRPSAASSSSSSETRT